MTPRDVFVTGTDTGAGKTRIAAALARAYVLHGRQPTIVKLVQTGLERGVDGDAAIAARLAGCASRELVRYRLPADPWSAALAETATPPTVDELTRALRTVEPPLVVEGTGGAAVPLNAQESLIDVAVRAGLDVVTVVGLRLGCVNHALLTVKLLRSSGCVHRGFVLTASSGPVPDRYVADVCRIIAPYDAILAVVPFDGDAQRNTDRAARLMLQSSLIGS